jgi:hypothetical protein
MNTDRHEGGEAGKPCGIPEPEQLFSGGNNSWGWHQYSDLPWGYGQWTNSIEVVFHPQPPEDGSHVEKE